MHVRRMRVLQSNEVASHAAKALVRSSKGRLRPSFAPSVVQRMGSTTCHVRRIARKSDLERAAAQPSADIARKEDFK
jgi:hypothetical protein